MTRPREVVPGRFYLITRRCAQRQFLLRPDKVTNDVFAYCLATSADHYKIDVIATCAMSNHHHTVIFDRDGRYPEFLENFHRLTARCMNLVRNKRRENFWSSEQVNVVWLADRAAVIEKICYTLVNPVRHNMVADARQWPGVNTYRNLMNGTAIKVRRPRMFFRPIATERQPDEVELRMKLPPELLNGRTRAELLADIKDHMDFAHEYWLAHHAKKGRRPVGRDRARTQSWEDFPPQDPNHRQWKLKRNRVKPTRATRDKLRQQECAARSREFRAAYREARAAQLA
ncbi:MAG TPA: hypothetical protein VFQ53_07615, partial [Kofleriaceae bacterium]|nr:hypothetical protein [Kofleriaceae bacterium]